MFLTDLALKFVLTIDGAGYEVPCGQIKNFSLELHNYGFDASVDFWIEGSTDVVFMVFNKQTLIQVGLVVDSYYNPPDVIPVPVSLIGFVYEKSVEELNIATVENIPILYRHYFVRFTDVAKFLWKQHFPCELFVDKTMKDVFDAHKGAKITLEYDWSPLDVQHPILFLGLGDHKNKASFYDFTIWYIESQNGVFAYDSTLNKYKMSTAKEDKGKLQILDKLQLDTWRIYFPEIPRHNVFVLNAYSENAQKEEITNEQAVAGIRKDILTRTPIASIFTARKTLEEGKLKLREHEVEIAFKKFPIVTVIPGYLISLAGGGWGETNFTFTKTYRIFDVSMKAKSVRQDPAEDKKMKWAGYEMDVVIKMELQSETYVHLPEFETPHYPVHIEGKIVSERGKEAEETYQFYQESKTSQDVYKVSVPLWDNQKVIVAYDPNLFHGHFYFPAFKNARVLLAMEFQSAWIKRFLDWRAGARLPLDGQGNHILFGLTAESQTSLNHVYENQKPVWNLKRISEKDTEFIQLKEGTMILQTKEEQ